MKDAQLSGREKNAGNKTTKKVAYKKKIVCEWNNGENRDFGLLSARC